MQGISVMKPTSNIHVHILGDNCTVMTARKGQILQFDPSTPFQIISFHTVQIVLVVDFTSSYIHHRLNSHTLPGNHSG